MRSFAPFRKIPPATRTEILAGLTTFSAMMYILVVNPAILAETGMDRESVLGATILASAAVTALMGYLTNFPIALAPGMGLNAFFTYTICLQSKVPWPAALGLVFYSGLLFLIVTLLGLRQRVFALVPRAMRLGLTGGIGLFIALIGLKNSGLVVANPATIVSLGSFADAGHWIVFAGILVAAYLGYRRVPGHLLLSIAFITIGFAFLGKVQAPASVFSAPPSLSPTFLKLDLRYFWENPRVSIPIVLSLFFVYLFDNMGTLLAVCTRARLVNADGSVKNLERALRADAFAAMFGAVLGTSSVVSFIESVAGVEQGGRTRIVAYTVAVCFVLSLFIAPLLLIVPAAATTPALVLVGAAMIGEIAHVDHSDLTEIVPAFLTLILIPFSFSIGEGFAIGLVAYGVLKAAKRLAGAR